MSTTRTPVPSGGDLFDRTDRDPTRVVRVGVLGAADAGVPHLRALTASVPGARVVVVHDDGDRRRLAELAEHAGARIARHPRDVVADHGVDAVVVAGPDPLPALWDCLEAGVPAYVEPGRALDADEVRALVSLEEAGGRRMLQVGFVRRHDPAHLALRRDLLDARAGDVRLLRGADRGGRPDRAPGTPWPTSLLGCLDAVAWLLGRCPVSVRVDAAGAADSPTLLTLRVGPETLARVEVHDACRGGHDVRCQVVGSTGVLELTPAPAVRLRTAGRSATGLPTDTTARFADAHRIGLTAWVRSLRTGRPLGADTWDWYAATHLAAAAATAQATGGEAPVDPGPRPTLYDAAPDRVTAQPLVPRSPAPPTSPSAPGPGGPPADPSEVPDDSRAS